MFHNLESYIRTTNRKSLTSLAVAVVLALGGSGAIAFGILSQQVISVPSASAAGIITPMKSHSLVRPKGPVLPYATPVSLSITAIRVRSQLQQVGLNSDGSIQVPNYPHFDEAAWYKNSPAPGQYGASVIVGHVDNYYTGASVFFDLSKLHPKDIIHVKRADGIIATFSVTAVRLYTKADFPTKMVYSNNGNNDAELHLITCGGTFNRRTGHYESNTIVFAKLVGSSVR